MTAEQAREEIAADFTEMIFTDEKTLRRFVETHSKTAEGRNMLQRLFDAIRRFIARLGKMDESVLPGMNITREQLLKAEQLYREVLAEGAQQRTGVIGDGGKRQGQHLMWFCPILRSLFRAAIFLGKYTAMRSNIQKQPSEEGCFIYSTAYLIRRFARTAPAGSFQALLFLQKAHLT